MTAAAGVAGLVAIGVTPLATAASAAGSAARYASPHGSGSSCSKSDPCSLTTAVNSAPAGASVILTRGSYGSEATPIATTLQGASGLDIQGQTGGAMPAIYSSAHRGVVLDGGTLSELQIHFAGSTDAVVADNADVNHVIVDASGTAEACQVNGGSLSDSLCTADDGAAAGTYVLGGNGPVSVTTEFRNVTAEATGSDGVGLDIAAATQATSTATATNDIAQGGAADVKAEALDAGTSQATVTLSHSDFATTVDGGVKTQDTIHTDSTDISAAPHFTNAGHGDYEETASSLTVDAGAKAPKHDTDLLGEPRTLGKAPDIGAYELLVKPKFGHVHVKKVSAHTAHLSVAVNPEGLPTTVKATAKSGSAHAHSPSKPAGDASHSATIHLTLHHLHSHRAYHVHVEAKNNGGKATSATVVLHTQ